MNTDFTMNSIPDEDGTGAKLMEGRPQMNEELDWDARIEEKTVTLLEPGIYDAKLTWFSRGRFKGSEKLPPCNAADLTVAVYAPDGIHELKTKLFLIKRLEWKLCEFFRAIGRKKKGEEVVMSWTGIVGLPLRVEIGVHEYEQDGEKRQSNEIKKFMDYDETEMRKTMDRILEADRRQQEAVDKAWEAVSGTPAWLQDAMAADPAHELDEVF